jgi:uncharacterized protein YdeI (YjbR/CyaY-like superfamily)
MVFYKTHTKKPSPTYDDAVEEALCVGWIDSLIKKRDADSYMRKMTPRKPGSNWSPPNKKRVAALIAAGLMAEAGLAKVTAAKESGDWDRWVAPEVSSAMPSELTAALAKTFFESLAPSYRSHFVMWINAARRDETKARRAAESIALLEAGKKLGLK